MAAFGVQSAGTAGLSPAGTDGFQLHLNASDPYARLFLALHQLEPSLKLCRVSAHEPFRPACAGKKDDFQQSTPSGLESWTSTTLCLRLRGTHTCQQVPLLRAGTGVHFVALTDRRGLVFITTEGHQKT